MQTYTIAALAALGTSACAFAGLMLLGKLGVHADFPENAPQPWWARVLTRVLTWIFLLGFPTLFAIWIAWQVTGSDRDKSMLERASDEVCERFTRVGDSDETYVAMYLTDGGRFWDSIEDTYAVRCANGVLRGFTYDFDSRPRSFDICREHERGLWKRSGDPYENWDGYYFQLCPDEEER